jgi:hypothetical protein
MLNYQRLAACLLIALASNSLARGPLYKCQDREGRVTLRDERCRDGERVVSSVRPGEITRKFTIVTPPPALPAQKPASQPTTGAKPPAKP